MPIIKNTGDKRKMKQEIFNLWKNTPGMCEETPKITFYKSENKKSPWSVVILPGGGYCGRAPHEGEGYAEFLNENGIDAFVVDYRVSPHRFPLPLLDSRRAMRFVRFNAEKFGIDKNKIAIMGSSAGGHLAALTSTYFDKIDFEDTDDIDNEDFIPNAQILCYPVIKLIGVKQAHLGSGISLLDDKYAELAESVTPELIVSEKTPTAFIWCTLDDQAVPAVSSLDYAKALREKGVPAELHIFPHGVHGLGLATGNEDVYFPTDNKHVSKWSKLMLEWLEYIK